MFWITYVVQFYSLFAIFNLLIDNYSKEEILLQIDFIQRSVSYSILDYQWQHTYFTWYQYSKKYCTFQKSTNGQEIHIQMIYKRTDPAILDAELSYG